MRSQIGSNVRLFVALAAPLFVACADRPASPKAAAAPTASTAAAARVVRGATHVTFPSRDADLTHGAPTNLDAWIFRPEGDEKRPAIVLLHGCAGLFAKDGELTARHRDWAERLASQGYVVIMPDSFGPRGVEEICSADPQPIRPGYERARDAYGALEYLEAQPFVDSSRIGIMGWSNGGSSVLASISAHTRARSGGLAHDFRVAVAFYPGCERTLGRDDWMPPTIPLTILIGERDDWTPARPCEELVTRAHDSGAQAQIIVYKDSFHDFDDPHMKLQTKKNVATTPSHTATLGTNPIARADSIERVTKIFRDAIGEPGTTTTQPAPVTPKE